MIESVKEVTANEGEDIELECSCNDCLPIKKSSWKYENKGRRHKVNPMVDEEKDFYKTQLQIKNVVSDDEGSYECIINNEFKNGGKQTKKIELIVKKKPEAIRITLKGRLLSIVEKVVEIKTFEDFTLDCYAPANPVPIITWFKNGKQVGDHEIFLPQSKMNNHEGSYECKVENDVGLTSRTIQVKVKIPPYTESDNDQRVIAKNAVIVSLKCDIIGSPDPKIQWFINSKPLKASKQFKLLKQDKVLEFKGSKDLVGNYSCSGVSDLGKALIIFDVVMTGKKISDDHSAM